MAAQSLSAVASGLMHAPDAGAALAIVRAELIPMERTAGVTLLAFDPRREGLINAWISPHADPAAGTARPGTGPGGSAGDGPCLALDHLPPPVRHAVLSGERFADVGEQAAQYGSLLGVDQVTSGLRLLLKGIVIEGALVAVVALHETRRRGGSHLLARAEALLALLELAFVRLYEREARFEAVAALHDVTSRMRAEHASATAALEREVIRLRAAQETGTSAVVRELRDAVRVAQRRAAEVEERLRILEAQVTSAVDRLQRSHVQLAEQDASIRSYRETIRQLHAQLEHSRSAGSGS